MKKIPLQAVRLELLTVENLRPVRMNETEKAYRINNEFDFHSAFLKINSFLMKKILVSVFILTATLSLYSQAPEGFSYLATVRNDTGMVMINQPVTFRFRILKDCPVCTLVYEEIHYDTTNYNGSVSLIIGNGIDTTGSFAAINWGSGSYFLNVGLDTTGGVIFSDMGTSQFLSVPYSLYSKIAANGFSGNYNDLTHKPITNGSETKVNAGINITVTGIGTIANPYIINSETSISAGSNLTISGSGTKASPYLLDTKKHYIGESYGGGIVFYIYDNGLHGLIAAGADQDPGISWYNGTKRYTNTTGDGAGAGEMNTMLIIALQTNDNQLGNFAAKVCADYSVASNGIVYGDWYLPSKLELNLMYFQKDLIGGFTSSYYWSSTEFSSITAWSQNFANGIQNNMNKSNPYAIRAIRAF
jgi:hypothetical protein